MDEKQTKEINTDQQFEIGFFRPKDAEGIASLFRSVYGEGYPIRVFYDPQELIRANESGDYYSLVARNSEGRVAAVEHLFRSAPYRSAYEAGAGLTLKEYRNLGLAKRLLGFMYQEWVPGQKSIEETFGESVCNHTHMHKIVLALAHVETALEIALMPAEAYDAERSSAGRVAALMAFRCYKPKPHGIFLPRAYDQELRFIYSALDDRRELSVADSGLTQDCASEISIAIFDFARVARMAVHQAGPDFETRLDELEAQALNGKTVVNQVWLKLAAPWVGTAVDILRDRGYFFGGALPRWFDQDGFLMQKLRCSPDFEEIKLASDRSREILDIVKRDWCRAKSLGA
jgi:hypothetical protein